MEESELIRDVNKAVEDAIKIFNEEHPGANREEARRLIIEVGEVLKEKNYTKAMSLAMKAQAVARGQISAMPKPAGQPSAMSVPPVSFSKAIFSTPPAREMPSPDLSAIVNEVSAAKETKPASEKVSVIKNLPWKDIAVVVLLGIAILIVLIYLPI